MAKPGEQVEIKSDLPAQNKPNQEHSNQSHPDKLIELAINQNLDIDKLDRLMQMKTDHEDREAKKAYNIAMVKAQSNMPIVEKDKDNKQTNSKYSSYEAILKATQPIYTKQGFSLSFYEGETPNEDEIRVCVDIMHNAGHTETKWTDIPLDKIGIKGSRNKTNTHAKGSSISYGRSYLIKMVFNIPTGEDDGNAAGKKCITDEQATTIIAIMEEIGNSMDTKRFLRLFETDDVYGIPANRYKEAVGLLNKKKGS